jgi:hypothetical protein
MSCCHSPTVEVYDCRPWAGQVRLRLRWWIDIDVEGQISELLESECCGGIIDLNESFYYYQWV